MCFWFVAIRFLKPTLVILVSLEFFFVSIDSLQYLDRLPSAANLIVLFLAYDAAYALNYVLPLSLLFGLIVFYLGLIKSNQYIALLSLGYSKRRILLAPSVFILIAVFGYIGLNATPFAYAEESAQGLLDKSGESAISSDLFIRYGDDYVFFSRVFPLLSRAEGITVYKTENKDRRELLTIIESKEGYFENNEWNLTNPIVITMPERYELGGQGLQMQKPKTGTILQGFKPKILDTIYQNKPSISSADALSSLQILWGEKSDTSRVRGLLYTLVLVPFFIPLLAVIVAYYMPPLARYENLALLGILLSVTCLLVWGVFFSIGKLQANVSFIPEIGILAPLALLFVISFMHFTKLNRI